MIKDNDGVHIETIVANTACTNHGSDKGTPCWTVWLGSTKRFAPAVCGGRIKHAGFDGKIDPKSLSRFTGDKAKSRTHKSHPQKAYSK